jgi:D-alanine-D-alanine ligase-like ATP-grasp enzyme
MRICVLQVSDEGSTYEYRHVDTARDLSHLLPERTFHHEFLRKATAFRQIRALKRQGFDIYVNLCEGYLETDVPSVDVIMALEHLGLPYTGPNLRLYCPRKDLMNYVAESEGLACPAYAMTETAHGVVELCSGLRFPLIVKPNELGDSLGIDGDSLVHDPAALESKVREITDNHGPTIVEEYIEGREFSVLVCAQADSARPPHAFLPMEFRFPDGKGFKTYGLKHLEDHPEGNVPCDCPELARRLTDAACAVFSGFSGEGYARMDFRLSDRDELYFLEVNFGCSVFYPPGYEGSADFILRFDGTGPARFLEMIISEGLARHARKHRPYVVRPAKIGYGAYAARDVKRGETVLPGEERAHRIVTRSHVERHWSQADKSAFSRYAYPLGSEVFVLWDHNPENWVPQNHSCDANTGFAGLDIVALRDIGAGEELTLDYATLYDARMVPFDCRCGSPKCRGRITGSSGLFGDGRTQDGDEGP